MTAADRLERERHNLEEILEHGRWPTGLELTDYERRGIERNLERLVDRLRVPEPEPERAP